MLIFIATYCISISLQKTKIFFMYIVVLVSGSFINTWTVIHITGNKHYRSSFGLLKMLSLCVINPVKFHIGVIPSNLAGVTPTGNNLIL